MDGSVANFRTSGFDTVGSLPITAGNPFKGRQYPGEVILLAVRWYLRYPLAYEHVSELLTERGLVRRSQLHLALGPSLCARVE